MSVLGKIYGQPLYCIFIWIVLLVFLWMLARVVTRRSILWRIGNSIVALISIYGILLFTVINRKPISTEPAILIPFHSIIEAQMQPEKYREMIMNIFLFVPFGLSFPNMIEVERTKKKYTVIVTVLVACAMSSTIEYLQFFFHLGRCEIDDVIMNTLGALIGILSYICELDTTGINEIHIVRK